MSAPAQSTSLYDALAPLYDAWQNAGGGAPFSELVLSKLDPALARWGRPATAASFSFLDLGCGTGELLLSLRRLHPDWRLLGIDASAQMLSVARRKQPPPRADITWIESALTTAPLPGSPVDAVGAFYDTVNHLPDAATLQQLFPAVAAALRPGGLFIFDTTNEIGFARWWHHRNEWSGPGWQITVVTRFDPDASGGTGQADVTIVQDGQPPITAHLLERCFPDSVIRQGLSQAGLHLEVAEPWSPFQIDAPGKTWWITRKMTT